MLGTELGASGKAESPLNHQAISSVSSPTTLTFLTEVELGMVTWACHPNTQEVETRNLEFKAGLGGIENLWPTWPA